MGRIVYVNGHYVPEEQASVSIFDRGFLFADGVYEVSAVLRGRLVDNAAHLARLQRSLDELDMTAPADAEEIEDIQRTLIKRNALDEGTVYLQITRGTADRDFAFPTAGTPSLVMFTQARSLIEHPAMRDGIAIITLPDMRWRRRDIKTVSLLPASMAKQAALNAGAADAWLVEDGYVTEASASNAYIVTHEGHIVTRHLGNAILHGITRAAILALSRTDGTAIEERPFSVEEARHAAEAFITSASTFLLPVVSIDGQPVGDGCPGPVAKRLRTLYIEAALANCGSAGNSGGHDVRGLAAARKA